MFLAHRKGLRLDGTHPVYLTGYGGSTVSKTPRYSSTAVPWAESGGVYALPSLRGGAEFGEDWHRAALTQRPVQLNYDVKAGHSSGRPVSKRIKDDALVMHFLYWQLGMTPPAAPAKAAPAGAAR